MRGGHGVSRYKAGCHCDVCSAANRAAGKARRARLMAAKAAEHAGMGPQFRCRCAACSSFRQGVEFVSAVSCPRLVPHPGAVPGRDLRAVVCCEVEAFEPEGSGHDPFCPTVVGGAA